MASLLLGDLNDYLEPSQACILPPSNPKEEEDKKEETPVAINLTDCLACSGCITSAESILVAQQTYSRLLDAVDSKEMSIAISVSPQAIAALAVRFKLSTESTWRRLNYFLKTRLRASLVLDTTHARSLTLACLFNEFLEWMGTNSGKPLIVSACPGWVCYAEKRYKEFLPLLSRTRSPQQMAGTLAKHYYPSFSTEKGPRPVYHCTVMPCFDKKLEASRADFVADLTEGTREVDTVITTTELLQILDERLPPGVSSFADLPEDPECEPVARHEGSGSGGYLEYVLAQAIASLYPDHQGHIKRVPGRNADSLELHYVDSATDSVLLRFAAISGFRNIQTFVIKSKQHQRSSLPPLDFVEIMACPGGCLNGGGQPKAISPSDTPLTRQEQKAYADSLVGAYTSAQLITSTPDLVHQVLEWVEQAPEPRARLLKASYQAVNENEQLKKAINVQW